MMLPKISQSTFDNVSREYFRGDSMDYILNKIDQMGESNKPLLQCINDLANGVFVDSDDASEDDKRVNKMRAVACMLILSNVINTQMEIDWLKQTN